MLRTLASSHRRRLGFPKFRDAHLSCKLTTRPESLDFSASNCGTWRRKRNRRPGCGLAPGKCFLTNTEKPKGEAEQRQAVRQGLSCRLPSRPRDNWQPEPPSWESRLRLTGLRDQGLELGTTWWAREGMLGTPLSLSAWASSSVKQSFKFQNKVSVKLLLPSPAQS